MEEEIIIDHVYSLLFDYQTAMRRNDDRLLRLSSGLHEFIKASPFRPPHRASLIEILGGARETITSEIIAKIFAYQEAGDYVLLNSFLRTFVSAQLNAENPRIEAEKSRLDISIKDTTYGIIIENKLKDAAFQRNQLARYVKKLYSIYEEDEIYIIVLPRYIRNIPQSVKRLPSDWWKKNDDRACRVGQYHCWCDSNEKLLADEQRAICASCDKEIISRLENRFITLHDDFADWLIHEADSLPSEEWPMKSFMMQFADYLKGLYSTRFNQKLAMSIQNYLRDKILTGKNAHENWSTINETIEELDQLKANVERLREVVCNDMVKEWESSLREDYSNIRNDIFNGVYSFCINVKGVWIGCWSGTGRNNNNIPYWGCWTDKKPTLQQIKMVKAIFKRCGYDCQIEVEQEYMYRENTFDGDVICRNLYNAAIELDYL